MDRMAPAWVSEPQHQTLHNLGYFSRELRRGTQDPRPLSFCLLFLGYSFLSSAGRSGRAKGKDLCQRSLLFFIQKKHLSQKSLSEESPGHNYLQRDSLQHPSFLDKRAKIKWINHSTWYWIFGDWHLTDRWYMAYVVTTFLKSNSSVCLRKPQCTSRFISSALGNHFYGNNVKCNEWFMYIDIQVERLSFWNPLLKHLQGKILTTKTHK